MPAFSITVFGKVQGVWYRASTRKKALELGITGIVRNQSDGSVYIEAQGKAAQIQALIDWCKQGPTHAQVDDIIWNELPEKEFTAFSIVR